MLQEGEKKVKRMRLECEENVKKRLRQCSAEKLREVGKRRGRVGEEKVKRML